MGVDRAVAHLAEQGRQPGEGVVVAVLDSGVVPSTGIPLAGQLQAGREGAAGVLPRHRCRRPDRRAAASRRQPGGDRARRADPRRPGLRRPGANEATAESSPITARERPERPRPGDRGAGPAQHQGRHDRAAAAPRRGHPASGSSSCGTSAWSWSRPPATGPATTAGSPSVLDEEYESHRPGEDVAELIHPADYEHVLAVNATDDRHDRRGRAHRPGPGELPDRHRRPDRRAVSYSVQGGTCVLDVPATSWATAEVSGVLALLLSAYDDTPAAGGQPAPLHRGRPPRPAQHPGRCRRGPGLRRP